MRRLHWPAQLLPQSAGLLALSLVWYVSGTLACLALAMASYHGVEVFFIRLKDRGQGPSTQPTTGS